ncbi:unnamed protein product [Leptosia nina]|uniref:Cadherin domain-containing protein n=1 Tax=Leptosia nina TaxID=320188 RepID=A0AAV1JT59_9NEOP
MSSESTTSSIRQFGLYRTIDARTEEFLRLSRKRQLRQGCICAAISTAITVIVVIIIILIYEYSNIGNTQSVKSNWLGLMNESADHLTFDVKHKSKLNFDQNTIKLLPVLLKAISRNKYYDQDLYDSTSPNSIGDVKETTDQIHKNIFADTRNWMKMTPSRLYAIEFKTSPIVYFKNPTRSIDYYRKARKIRDYERVMNYVDKMISDKVTAGSTQPMLKPDLNKYEKTMLKATTPIYKTDKPETLSSNTHGTFPIKLKEKHTNCNCCARISLLLRKLITSLQKIIPEFVNNQEEKRKNCNVEKSSPITESEYDVRLSSTMKSLLKSSTLSTTTIAIPSDSYKPKQKSNKFFLRNTENYHEFNNILKLLKPNTNNNETREVQNKSQHNLTLIPSERRIKTLWKDKYLRKVPELKVVKDTTFYSIEEPIAVRYPHSPRIKNNGVYNNEHRPEEAYEREHVKLEEEMERSINDEINGEEDALKEVENMIQSLKIDYKATHKPKQRTANSSELYQSELVKIEEHAKNISKSIMSQNRPTYLEMQRSDTIVQNEESNNVVLLIYEYLIVVETYAVQNNQSKFKLTNDQPIADRLDRSYFGFDQDYFERMPLLVNALQENSYVDPNGEIIPLHSGRKKQRSQTSNIPYTYKTIRRTTPRPFILEYRSPNPTPFSSSFNSRSWIESYRNAQRLQNLNQVIKYLEKTLNAKFGDIYEPSTAQIAFSGVYVAPIKEKKVKAPEDCSTPRSSNKIEHKSNHQSDPLFIFKPDSPGDINLLADGYKFSPWFTSHLKHTNKNAPIFKRINEKKKCHGNICDTSPTTNKNDLSQTALLSKPTAFGVMLNLYPLHSTIPEVKSTPPVEQIYLTTVRPSYQFKKRSNNLPPRRTSFKLKSKTRTTKKDVDITSTQHTPYVETTTVPQMVVHFNVYSIRKSPASKNDYKNNFYSSQSISTTVTSTESINRLDKIQLPVLNSSIIEDYHAGSSGVLPVHSRANPPVTTYPITTLGTPQYHQDFSTESTTTNPPDIIKFSPEDAKIPDEYLTLRKSDASYMTESDLDERYVQGTVESFDKVDLDSAALSGSRTEDKRLVIKLKNILKTTTEIPVTTDTTEENYSEEEDEEYISTTTEGTAETYVPTINGHYRSSKRKSLNILLHENSEKYRKKKVETSVTFQRSTYVPIVECVVFGTRTIKKSKMAEIIFQRRKAATVLVDPLPLVIFLLSVVLCGAQVINRAPHFVPQSGDMSQFSVAEDTAVGTPVYQLKGIDPDNSPLRYSISGQYFSVDPVTGVVTLAKSLNREKQTSLEVIISITDEGIADTEPNTVSLRRVIPVKDVNDNPPVFHNRPYIVNISEATLVESEIEVSPKILVTDLDEEENAKIRVSCSTKERGSDFEACSTFRIVTDMISPNKYQVRIFLAKPLDFESRSAYVISLEAVDQSARPLRTTASVSVGIRDVQDQPPVFLNAPYSPTVPENTPAGTSILEIIAKDGDTANPRQVLLTLEEDSQMYFQLLPGRPIGRATLVTTNNPIDRESDIVVQNGGVYTFSIKATELINNEVPSDFTVIPVTVIVTDVDDHSPRFNKEVFDVSIPENIDNGSPIPGLSIYVEDIDLGQNSKYDLKLRNIRNSEGVFALSTEHGEGRTPLSIKVRDSAKLDYDVEDEDKRLFSFDIVASLNYRELSSARVNVKLLDVNDNAPTFEEQQYKLNVLENAPVGTKISDVSATDKDYGIFSEIEYTLSGFGAHYFKTDRNKGGVYVARELDYETQKSYSLTLFARDGGGKGSTTSIFIDVLDVNDNAPMFEASEYSRTIRDGATSFEPQLVIRATDIDGQTQGGGRVLYSLESDNSITHKGQVFSIDEETGEVEIVDKVETMDTPRGQYELLVRATDYGTPPLFNETRVYIRVGVPGNQRPTFKGNYHHYKYTVNQRDDVNEDFTFDLNPMNYKASIREDAKPGDNVTTVIANDPDGLDDLLTYHILSGSKDNFVINERTGLITVSSDANLDRDLNADRYEIIISAVDSGRPAPETATTTVFVHIADVNDKPPVFNTTESTTYISERTPINMTVTQVIAYDTDISAKLKYYIIDPVKAFSKAGIQLKPGSNYDYKNLFRIDEDTGEVTVNGKLDYSQASIVILTVKVVDINAELNKEQFASIEHTIYIQPYADDNPRFINPGWSSANPLIHHKIKEEQPIGSTVLVLMAEDPITNSKITNFKVIETESSLLQVDPFSGQVVLTSSLDYEELKSPNLTLTVQATSNDGTKHSNAKVVIGVININDNKPVFEKELYKVSVLESIIYPEHVVTVKAKDKDAVMTETDKAKGYSEVRYALRGENTELFVINESTGVIQVAPNKTLDRERQSVLRLEIEAFDTPAGGAERLKSSSIILLDVLDVDDNSPSFEKSVYTAVVPENVPIGISVVKLVAIDPDEGLGGEIKYEFLDEGEANSLFTIDPTTGEVKTRKELTGRGRTDPYRLLVGATDGGAHSGDTSLAIYIGDVSANDGVPRFIRPAEGEDLHISENATIGSTVFQVVASDPDDPTQPSGQLTYHIQRTGDDSAVFSLDPQTGVITTRQSLDRERKAAYTLVLAASDHGSPPQQSTRIVTVHVTDVDDHKPHFARNLDDPPLLMTTKEEVPIGTLIGKLKAIDEDIGDNAAIDYRIIAGNELEYIKLERSSNNEALIKAAARLDREAMSRVLITVKCFKFGATSRYGRTYNRLDPSEIQIAIKIQDIDDHLPEFDTTNMTIGVRLNVAVDTTIAIVRATDRDPDALPIDYSIVNMSFESPIKSKSLNNITDVIVVNNTTGEMRIMKNLIHYADGIFRLILRANNSMEEERFSDLHVEVVVVRERDLLRLVLPAGRARLAALKQNISQVLEQKQLKMQIHDATHDAFYDNMGPCFQFRQTETGEALTPKAMKSTIRSLGVEFQQILQAYEVRNITECGAPRALHSHSQKALLAVAGVLPIAALIAIIVLCCMHSNAKQRMRSALLLSREPPMGPPTNISGPTRIYAEPLYST